MKRVAVLVAGFLSVSHPALAWSDHALLTEPVLAPLREVTEAKPVQAESFQSFLLADEGGLVTLLADEEAWDRKNLPTYAPRPDALRFDATADADSIVERFLRSIRVNPSMKLPLFLQAIPGVPSTQGRPALPTSEACILKIPPALAISPFGAVEEGELLRPLDVVTTASDEPDYGLDIGLWEDSGTAFGDLYGFGPQSFGNGAVEFSSQAPFHMGFFHESAIVYWAADFLRRAYPEYRIHLYLVLARFAFLTGHPYWGWRFAGWGLHYIQDLTQPYHSTAVPGASVAELLWISGLDTIGIHSPKNARIQLETNRHFALENYEFETLRTGAPRPEISDPTHDGDYGGFGPWYAREIVSAESHARAAEADRILRASLPDRLVNDPSYLFGTTDPGIDVREVLAQGSTENQRAMESLLTELLAPVGAHSRNFIRAVLAP